MRAHGMGLLVLLCDYEDGAEDEARLWADAKHLPHAAEVPGIRGAAAYEAVRGTPRFLNLYEAEGVHVFYSEPFLEFWSETNDWALVGRRASERRLVCSQIYPALPIPHHHCPTVDVAGLAPVVQLGRIFVPPERQSDFHAWYARDRVPAAEGVPGMRRIRRYVPVEGERVNVVLYEMEEESVLESPEWKAARNSEWSLRVREYYQQAPGSPGLFRRRGRAR